MREKFIKAANPIKRICGFLRVALGDEFMSGLSGRMMNGVYVVTDGRLGAKRDHTAIAAAAVSGGAAFVQLRESGLPDKNLLEIAQQIRNLTLGTNTLFIINNRLDIAIACNADGVHVGQSDIPAEVARTLLGPDKLIGVSTGSVEEAIKAEADGADYVAIGPVFATPTKLDAGSAVGLEAVTRVRSAVKSPVVAIGGISAENIRLIAQAGADSAAVVSAVTGAADMVEAVKVLSEEFWSGYKPDFATSSGGR